MVLKGSLEVTNITPIYEEFEYPEMMGVFAIKPQQRTSSSSAYSVLTNACIYFRNYSNQRIHMLNMFLLNKNIL